MSATKTNLRCFDKISSSDLKKLGNKIGSIMVKDTVDNFKKEKSPDNISDGKGGYKKGGTKWKPSRRVERAGSGKTLQNTRRLHNSLNKSDVKVSKTGLTVENGTNVEYASINHATRPFLGLSNKHNKQINKLIDEAFHKKHK